MLKSEQIPHPMRFGRILLALLAPLLSLPALAADGAHVQKSPAQAPAVDSLLNLLRLVVPTAAADTDAAGHGIPRVPHAAAADHAFFTAASQLSEPSPAAEAALRLSIRQQHRLLLRC